MYMLNLISMVLMCILIVGVLIISAIIYLEGSLAVDPMIFVHLTIPAFVLVLNLYVILLEDHEEERFFKSPKKSKDQEARSCKGVILVNLALVASVLTLAIAAYFKFILDSTAGRSQVNPVYDDDYDDSFISGASTEKVIFIEECLLHALAVIESVTLREYAKAKVKDIIANRKRK